MYQQVCTDFDTATQTCVGVTVWTPVQSFFPVLSMSDSMLLGSLVVANWALAYAYRQVCRAVHR